ncbi:sporulation protein YunB [Tepidibacillus fermentans]|uniref:Sporulation protein YunB n=1 Tax=Tepidibacillus fermentans TaxID=1281767 RepID=A0A4R3K6P0_9BACI|nr:sporulation protein YunB [Tepidibacillus fermentans]TCS78457.1 sporulation protein YunB [Tepidibacillus fermentans]
MPRWGKRRRFTIPKLNIRLQKKNIIFFTIIIFLGLMVQTFFYIENQLRPILMQIAQARVKQIANKAVNDAITKKIAQNTNFKDLIQFEMDDQGKIRAALFNYSEFARIVGETTARVEDTLSNLDKIVEPIKLGAAFDNEIIADMGPSIPITIIPIGHAEVTPKTTYQNAGINVVVMTVVIEIKAEVEVVIPFSQAPYTITSEVPIAQTQIFGDVPQFYYDNSGNYIGTDPNKVQNVPPIQVIPETPTIPNNSTGGQKQE